MGGIASILATRFSLRKREVMAEIDKLYTVAGAAERLNSSVWTIRSWFRSKRLAKVRVGGRAMTSESAILKFLADCAKQPTRKPPNGFAVNRKPTKARRKQKARGRRQ